MTEKALLTNREKVKVEKSGADFLMDALKKQNVDVIFGYPGGAVLPIYDKLYSSGLFIFLPDMNRDPFMQLKAMPE